MQPVCQIDMLINIFLLTSCF